MNNPNRRDPFLSAVVLVLLVLGLVMVQSASGPVAPERGGDSFYYVKRQLMGVFVGGTGCVALAWIPYRWLQRYTWHVYGAALIGLALVFVPGLGYAANGATRWIGFGGFHFQPSELGKIAVAMAMARFLSERAGQSARQIDDWKGVILPSLAFPVGVASLLMLEPDFGTTVIVGGLTVLLLYLAGLRTRYIAAVGGLGVAAAVLMIALAPYRLRRLESFIDPWIDPAGSGYQVIQSLIAFSSGGAIGRGLGQSQSKHLFLPEPWTDFIGSVLAEELGLFGIWGLLALYGLLIWRGLEIARQSRDLFGSLLAASLTTLIGVQGFFNLGVAMGVVPLTGLVLPFISYGPSALMMHLFIIGLLLNISANGAQVQPVFRRIAIYPMEEPAR